MGRFNVPDASFGVLYSAKTSAGAFAEIFLRTLGRRLIDIDQIRRKAYVRLTAKRKLILIRLAGTGLSFLGATAEVTHSRAVEPAARTAGRHPGASDACRKAVC